MQMRNLLIISNFAVTLGSLVRHPATVASRPSMMALRMQSTASNNDRLFPEELNLIFDSKCSVCKLEVNYLISRMKKIQERKGISTDLIRRTLLRDR